MILSKNIKDGSYSFSCRLFILKGDKQCVY
nr:MAG TPA: hypothetical protein [Caudoviricetes sp.]